MKIRKNRMGWFIFIILVTLGYIGLMVYQILNNNFDPMNLIMILLIIDSFANCIEKKK